MRLKKLITAVLVLTIAGGTAVAASSATQKIKLFVNGSDKGAIGALIDGKPHAAIEQMAESLQAIVKWDSAANRANVFKPNVHLVLYNIVDDQSYFFGTVNQGNRRVKFKVFAQIDELKTDLTGFKISIFDPKGNETVIQRSDEKINSASKDHFWYFSEDFDYRFDQAGKYPVRFFMKAAGSDEWSAVSEINITSKATGAK